MKFTFHIVGLPHVSPYDAASSATCAYTNKLRRFADMMRTMEHEVFVYEAMEFSPYFGKVENMALKWDKNMDYWHIMEGAVVNSIAKKLKSKDFVCLTSSVQQGVVTQLKKLYPTLKFFTVEYGIGYADCLATRERDDYYGVFESCAWMHAVIAAMFSPYKTNFIPRICVIPNPYKEDEFSCGSGNGGYICFMGRLITRKGVRWVQETARFTGLKIKVAGEICEEEGKRLTEAPNIEYVGIIRTQEEKNAFFGNAVVTLVPTWYMGPFEGVHVESLMCGTPVIAPKFGVFTETITEGFNGCVVDSLPELIYRVQKYIANPLTTEQREKIRNDAIQRFGTHTVMNQYQQFFTKIYHGLLRPLEDQTIPVVDNELKAAASIWESPADTTVIVPPSSDDLSPTKKKHRVQE